MDNTNNQNQPDNLTKPTFDNPDDDKEYQNILNQYADVLSKNPTPDNPLKTDQSDQPIIENPKLDTPPKTEEATIPVSEAPIIEINPPISSPKPEKTDEVISKISDSPISPEETLIHPSLNSNIDDDDDENKKPAPPVEDLISQAKNISSSPRPSLDDQNFPSSLPPRFNIFKIFFIISLIIFLGVAAAFAFFLLNQKSTSKNSSQTPTNIIEPTPILEEDEEGSCDLNGDVYEIGEAFPSEDGCNTCTCEEKDIITCTEKTCLATQSATITPTKAATTTSTKAATASTKKITPTPTTK